MKRSIIILLLFFLQMEVFGQNILFHGAAGGSGNDATIYVQWSMGEAIIFTPVSNLTQGFHQPDNQVGLPQTIVGFAVSSPITIGVPIITLPGTATSGLSVTFISSDPSVAKITGNIVQILNVGTVTITAAQMGNAIYKAAAQVLRPLVINKTTQSISGFNSIPVLTIGGVFTITGVSGGATGNPVIFTSSDSTIVSVKNNVLYFLNEGKATITATQAGNQNYENATPVSQVVTVAGFKIKRPQVISGLPNLIVLGIGEQKELNGMAGSGLAVTYLANSELITLTGNIITGVAKGSASITADQSGNDDFLAAPTVTIQVVVTSAGDNMTVSGIIGKETVVPLLFTDYKQVLEGAGYTYSWKYVGGPVNFIGDSTKSKVEIRFPENSKSGQLWSFIYDSTGRLIDYSIQNVTVTSNVSANVISQIQSVNCDDQASDCSDRYINSFIMGKIKNLNSGCSPAGQGDFTALRIDTLLMGTAYQAEIVSVNSNSPSYFGIWIDYNNNGSFDDAGEFVGSSFESDTAVVLPNLLILNDPAYIGPRRLRVKMRTTQINASESCTSRGEGGETEDYSVFIQQIDRLQAPNLLTPNNDGKNDLFIIHGINSKKSSHLIILDRWGEKKFEKDNYENDWDGKDQNGQPLNRGTYFFFYTNGPDSIQGFVEVINK